MSGLLLKLLVGTLTMLFTLGMVSVLSDFARRTLLKHTLEYGKTDTSSSIPASYLSIEQTGERAMEGKHQQQLQPQHQQLQQSQQQQQQQQGLPPIPSLPPFKDEGAVILRHRFKPKLVEINEFQWPETSQAFKRMRDLEKKITTREESVVAPLWDTLDECGASGFRRNNVPTMTRVAHLKTHKTASTTVSSILYRFAARNGLKMFKPPGHDKSGIPDGNFEKYMNDVYGSKFHMEFHHISPFGRFHGRLSDVFKFYRHIISQDVAIITTVREPKQQFVSWVYFFIAPQMAHRPALDVLREFALDKKITNPLAGEYGIYGEPELEQFLANDAKSFAFLLLFESLDESLVLLRRMLNWNLLDISYIKLLDSHTAAGSVRWDGKPVEPTPKFDTLPLDIQAAILDSIDLDQRIYDEALRRYQLIKAKYGDGLKEEVECFHKMQETLKNVCAENPTHELCAWYLEPDFYRLFNDQGYSKPPLTA